MAKRQSGKKKAKRKAQQRSTKEHTVPIEQRSAFLKWIFSNPFLFSVLLNLFFFIVPYSMFDPFFRTNDDVGFLLKLSGTSIVTDPTPYIKFINVILGHFLVFLYKIFPGVPVYGYFMTVLMYLSFTAITYAIVQRAPKLIPLLAWLATLILLGLDLIVGMQFTLVSGLLTIAGGSLFILQYQGVRLKSPKYVLAAAVALMLTGVMVRYEAFMFNFGLMT